MGYRILTVGGSPRPDGFSARMLRAFRAGLREGGEAWTDVSFFHYDAYACGFAPCTDCRACRRFEGCVQPDMDGFWRDFESCDGMVLASPVYHLSFPAPLKVVFDRMQRYYNARFYLGRRPPVAKYRPVVLLASAGSPDEDGAVMRVQLERLFTVTHCRLVGMTVVSGTDAAGDAPALSASQQAQLTECAASFRDAVTSGTDWTGF